MNLVPQPSLPDPVEITINVRDIVTHMIKNGYDKNDNYESWNITFLNAVNDLYNLEYLMEEEFEIQGVKLKSTIKKRLKEWIEKNLKQ